MSEEELTLIGSDVSEGSEHAPDPAVGARFVGETDPASGSISAGSGCHPTAEGLGPGRIAATATGFAAAFGDVSRAGLTSEVEPRSSCLSPGSAAKPIRSGSPRSPSVRRFSGRTWTAGLVLAVVLGAILAILLHLAGSESAKARGRVAAHPDSEGEATQGSAEQGIVRAEPTGGGLEPLDVESAAPPTTSADGTEIPSREPLVGGAAPLLAETSAELKALELRAAVALRADDCSTALPLYQLLLAEQEHPVWSFAVRHLEDRCGQAETPPAPVEVSGLAPGQSAVDVELAFLGAEPEEAELRIFEGRELREVRFTRDATRLTLPRTGAQVRVDLACPQGFSADQSSRRLPAMLPPHLRLKLVCRRDRARSLVVVLTSGAEPAARQEFEVLLHGSPLGRVRGGVAHLLVEERLSEAVNLELRSPAPDVAVAEPVRWFSLDQLEQVTTQTFAASSLPRVRVKRPVQRPTAVPYRL